ncbi:MAG: alcohol dehydrogenase catalytic domain-containing protein [Bacteroidales bacterium]|nr:alcohol dehydrogenase catalytic domain-containing protein [Bacteroidales bacterium]
MKSMKLTGIRMMEMMEVPEPVLQNPGDVKIKLLTLGICGSDVHYYTRGKIGSQVVKYPFAVGHECAGMVVETGPYVSAVKEGDIIAVEPSMWCGKCDQCLSGRHHTCRNIKFLGCPGQAEGALSEYIVMPETSCIPLPGKLTADHGAISEPLSIGIYSVKKAGEIRGKNIAVLGFGPIGMSVTLAAKSAGAGAVFVTDKIDERLAIARKENVAFTANPAKEDIVKKIKEALPLGVDFIFECCGQQEAVDQAVEILKPGGSLIIVGIPDTDRWSLSVDDTRRKELSVQFIRRQLNCAETAIEMMNSGAIDISNMITHRFSFEQTKEAFDLVEGYCDGVMKAMIDF